MYKVKDIEAREMLVPHKKIQLTANPTENCVDYNPFKEFLGYGNVDTGRENTRYFIEVTSPTGIDNIRLTSFNGEIINYRDDIIYETHCGTLLALVEYFLEYHPSSKKYLHVARCTLFTDFSVKNNFYENDFKQITCTLVHDRFFTRGYFYTNVKEYVTKEELKSFGLYSGDFLEKEEIMLEQSIGYLDSTSYVIFTVTNPKHYITRNETYVLRIDNDIELECVYSGGLLIFKEKLKEITHSIRVVNYLADKKATYMVGSDLSGCHIQLIHKNKSKIASNTYVDNQVKEVALLTLANAGLITPLADDESILLDEDGKVLLV